MKLNFPSKIELVFIDAKTGKPVKNLITLLTIFAKEKNDYHVGPKISDNEGKVVYTKKDVEIEIQESQRLFIMDYKSDLKDCSRLVQVETLSEEGIKNFLQTRKEWGDIAKELKLSDKEIKRFLQSSNKNYVSVRKKIDVMSEEIQNLNKIVVIPR